MAANAEEIAKKWLEIPLEELAAPTTHDRQCYQMAHALLNAIWALEQIRKQNPCVRRIGCPECNARVSLEAIRGKPK